MANLLKIKNLHAIVENKEIQKGINLEVNEGEIHAIMGPNGSGKSTLTKLIQRLYVPESGRVMIDGVDLAA